jgi:hypothetical protein
MAKTIRFQKIKAEASKMPKGKKGKVNINIDLGAANLESKFRVQLTR